jgi:hypothetical protein
MWWLSEKVSPNGPDLSAQSSVMMQAGYTGILLATPALKWSAAEIRLSMLFP